ncbi:MAG: cysteine-rich CWC family protein [Bacteroidetes bacterium]|nr:cysteine-rich CWC family protein [Bacteroidota bacterium]
MCQHEIKTCPRCQKKFECKPGNITQCQCYGIFLSAELKAYIEERYRDCLCRDCLTHLQQEVNLFKEKYILRS